MSKVSAVTMILICFLSAFAAFAQTDKRLKIDSGKVRIDPRKLFDRKKIGKLAVAVPDIGVKGAYVSWNNYGGDAFELDVDPILTKNSKDAKIYVKNDKGEYAGAFIVRVEALDKNGTTLEVQERDFLGWTSDDTEAAPFDFRFSKNIWTNAVRFRLIVDAGNLLKEANTKNNTVVVESINFTGKEYSKTVSPMP